MILYAKTITHRLQHAAAWAGNYLFGQPLQIVTVVKELQQGALIINYSHQPLPFPSLHVQPHTLLFETNIQQQAIKIEQHQNYPYFFKTDGDLPFDVLAASFYLMQRYEEYLPHQKDKYGRYDHTSSLAYQNKFLHLPLIDLWMQNFKATLQKKFNRLVFTERRFRYTPTYDVDISYSYKGKGWLRNAGGLFRSLCSLRLNDCRERMAVLLGATKDPFDVYGQLQQLHVTYGLAPVYFLLLAQQQKGVDKNINPQKKIYKALIQILAALYKTGIHLSAAAANSPETMLAEKELLTHITGQKVTANRNHYLLFSLPDTYQTLQKKPLLIMEDFSMGYGGVNGFRASTCTPYYWYNLQTERSTALQIFPFCFMEATAIFQLQYSPQQALAEMTQLYETVKKVDGLFITIFHNHLIANDADGRPWMEMYQQFISNSCEEIATTERQP